ncbi:large subunit GTPase 1 homolog isoform X1 [Schistocerca serialis cubense]|uniref:large subunit GTPase 1 homolog isoform X1 n=1 Tax=Schistocerca serialis cubense TaxID=2023355 RepID=UPI00214F2E5B|nr:large subunit GTPase 1 homolog isoform X1 [Schistocerca serialis cubense]
MGKKNRNSSSLGRALIRDRFGSSHRNRKGADSLLHTAEINDGYDWGRLNLQSVTEESSFQEFLSTAELAGTEFQAEKLNIKFVDPKATVGLLTDEEKRKIRETQEKNKHLVGIPRRPPWDETTTAEELQTREREAFLEWRRRLATLQEAEGLVLTPYEKNLEFWRQLWRVVERSDVVVQILDARNPLLYRCRDLERYVSEQAGGHKLNVLLLNKADLLQPRQRAAWGRYFRQQGVLAAFFSATRASEEQSAKEDVSEDDGDHSGEEGEESDGAGDSDGDSEGDSDGEYATAGEDEDEDSEADGLWEDASDGESRGATSASTEGTTGTEVTPEGEPSSSDSDSFGKLLNCEELVALLQEAYRGRETVLPGVTTVGLVGYPNVGKSSTINALLGHKKVSVSATPGKTKHFQTLFLMKELMLCDCPGLVMPSFALSKAEMVCWGVLPVDQMRDCVPPVALVASLIPRRVLEGTYGFLLPPPREGEDPDRPPSARELLDAHGYCRGFMTQNGQPDNPRSARYILKDFISGKLLYCCAPPGVDQAEYHTWTQEGSRRRRTRQDTPLGRRILKPNRVTAEDLDKQFFRQVSVGVHSRGPAKLGAQPAGGGAGGSGEGTSGAPAKPWKNHKEKRNRREKLRRLYAHLDQ